MIPKASLIRVSAFQNYNICTCQLNPVPLSEMQGTANGGQHQATDRATDPARVPVTITITHGMVGLCIYLVLLLYKARTRMQREVLSYHIINGGV